MNMLPNNRNMVTRLLTINITVLCDKLELADLESWTLTSHHRSYARIKQLVRWVTVSFIRTIQRPVHLVSYCENLRPLCNACVAQFNKTACLSRPQYGCAPCHLSWERKVRRETKPSLVVKLCTVVLSAEEAKADGELYQPAVEHHFPRIGLVTRPSWRS